MQYLKLLFLCTDNMVSIFSSFSADQAIHAQIEFAAIHTLHQFKPLKLSEATVWGNPQLYISPNEECIGVLPCLLPTPILPLQPSNRLGVVLQPPHLPVLPNTSAASCKTTEVGNKVTSTPPGLGRDPESHGIGRILRAF